MHPYLNIAIKAIRLASKTIVNASLHLDAVEIIKQNSNCILATSIDEKVEQTIVATILRAYPDHNIQGKICGHITNNSPFTWIIDPLDGVYNFVHDFANFAVSIAVLHEDQIEHAVIYNPITDELFSATKGSGAKLNNKRIRCSKTRKLSESLVAVNNNLLLEKNHNFAFMLDNNLNRYFGSVALQLAFVAAGRLDGYIDINLTRVNISAGLLLVREAGGYITDFAGKHDFSASNTIIATNQHINTQLLALVTN